MSTGAMLEALFVYGILVVRWYGLTRKRQPISGRRMRAFAGLGVLLALLGRAGTSGGAEESDTTLSFLRDGAVVKTFDRPALERACHATTVTIDDALYGRTKHYRACPLAEVLALGFGEIDAETTGVDLFFRARDGYQKPAPIARVLEPGGYLAFADADRMHGDDPGWEPLDRKQVDPGPYYVVWEKPAQRDAHRYPWPYQLAAIELTAYATRYPHTAPTGVPAAAPAWRGFGIFRTECIACHAVNGEGGTIGPELNVPQSIVEYRPVDQVKAYIRNPRRFRYTSMPAYAHLSDTDLDALIAYFRAMRDRKHDPNTGAAAAGENQPDAASRR